VRDIVRKPKSPGFAPRVVAIGVVACLIGSACSTTAGTSSPAAVPSSSAPGQTAPGCLVGEAWNNYAEEVIELWHQPAVEKQILAAGYDYDWVDAKSSSETQATQIDELVAEGAKVIIVRVQGYETSLPPETRSAIDRAAAAGVAVIAYEYLVDDPKALIVAFDPVEIGRLEARAILAAKPKGNYVILKGDPRGQFLPDLMASGIHEVLQPAIDKGDIKIVAETSIVNWDPNTALEAMRSILSQNQNKVDAVIAESDGMAAGAIEALKEVGLDGKVAVAGQGGDTWSLNHVAAGTQTVDVWPDPRLMGKAAGDAAVAPCKNPDIARLEGTSPLSLPGPTQVPSILLKPQAITKDNLNVVLDAGWVTKDYVCASIAPSKAPPACR
jgi:D-xylose transport system substrate-binding protein